MLELKGGDFLRACTNIAESGAWIAAKGDDKENFFHKDRVLEEVDRTYATARLTHLLPHLDVLGAAVTRITVTEAQTALAQSWADWGLVRQRFEEVKNTLRRELSLVTLIALDPKEKAYYAPTEPLFGPAVHERFPDARDDIEESGKCLALQRNKAVVCHLMLAMEHALRALADKLGAAVHADDGKWLTWLVIANNMDPRIRSLPEGDEKVAWWEVQSMLTSVGKAWRNPSMHPAKTYDAQQAAKVFEAVKGFMHDLALVLEPERRFL